MITQNSVSKDILTCLNQIWFYAFISALFWPILSLAWLFFFVIKLLISIILKIKIGRQYGGLLRLEDLPIDRTDLSQCVIGTVIIFKSKNQINMMNYIKKTLQEKVFNRSFDDYVKLTSTRHEYFGYSYYLKNDYSVDECVMEIPSSNKPISEEYLKQFTVNLINSPFPKNDTAVWDVSVSKSHLEKTENETYFRYPVIFKFSHVVADGTSLAAFLGNTFASPQFPIKDYNEEIFIKEKVYVGLLNKPWQFICEIFKYLCFCFHFIFICPGLNIATAVGKGSETPLHKSINSGNSYVAWPTVSTTNYISKIKKMKRRIPNTTFSDIVFTSLSMSLSRYFKRNSHKAPEYITLVVPTILYYPKPDYSQPAKLQNKSAFFHLNLYTGESLSPLNTLEKVKAETKKINIYDIWASRIIAGRIIGTFPKILRTGLLPLRFPTMLHTSVPGSSELQISDSFSIEKCIPISPHIGSLGVGMALISYGDEFLMTLRADRNLELTEREAGRIVNDCYHYLDELDLAITDEYVENVKKHKISN